MAALSADKRRFKPPTLKSTLKSRRVSKHLKDEAQPGLLVSPCLCETWLFPAAASQDLAPIHVTNTSGREGGAPACSSSPEPLQGGSWGTARPRDAFSELITRAKLFSVYYVCMTPESLHSSRPQPGNTFTTLCRETRAWCEQPLLESFPSLFLSRCLCPPQAACVPSPRMCDAALL